MEAVPTKFTPEFMNQIDKVVVFHPVREKELRQILNIELNVVQERVFQRPTRPRLSSRSRTK